jgi:hypothetical protein
MPFSAYVKAGLFVVAAAATLFAAAGTVALPGFWAYLAILAAVMIVSFAVLDPDLLRERMRPGGKKPPFSLRIFLARSVHALDRCRARPWPFPLERQRARLAAGLLPVHGRGRLCFGTVGYAREPVFLLSYSHPDRPRPARCHHGTLRLRPPSRIHRRDPDHSGKRTRARIVARGRACCGLQPAVSAPPRHHGGPNSSGGACGLFGLRRAGPMAASPGPLVRAKPA